MDSLTVLQNVPVKVVITASFRAQLVEQIRTSLSELDQGTARLKEARQQAAEPEFRERVDQELSRQGYQRQQLEWRIKEAESLAEGAEINFQTLPVMVQLKVGDNLQEKAGLEVVLKDWKVVEIRRGSGSQG